MFYREFPIPQEILNDTRFDGFKSCFSIRLGMNTIDNTTVSFNKIGSNFYCWDFFSLNKNIQSHYNYPFSVDGNIYNKNALLNTIKKVFYYNPNTFESYVVNYVRKNKLFEKGICYENSSLIGFELNQVNISDNNHFNISIRDLNTWFLNKYTLKYDFDRDNVTAFRPLLKGIQLYNYDTSDSIELTMMK
jgi:hypothetical protein